MFSDDLAYCTAGLHHLRSTHHPNLNFEVDAASGAIKLDALGDLRHRFSYFPPEVRPEDWRFELTADKKAMERAIEDSRKDERAWPRKQFLWRQNPVVEWLNDRLLATFGRHEAPVLAGIPNLRKDEVAFAFSGVVPNLRGHPLVCTWGAAMFSGSGFTECITLESLLARTGLDRQEIPNRRLETDLRALTRMLPEAIGWAEIWVGERREAFDRENDPKLQGTYSDLEALKKRQMEHAERAAAESKQWDALKRSRLDRKRQEVEEIFTEYLRWVEDTMTLEKQAWIKLLCVMTGEG